MKIRYLSMRSGLVWRAFQEILRGKSIMRMLMNDALRHYSLEGDVLDLGSKSNAASYNRFLKLGHSARVTYTDINSSSDDVVQLNLEEPFPMEEQLFDVVTCFNTLEHIYNYNNVIGESHRVLKKGGRFIGATPFLVNVHPDPNDYFRYTHQALVPLFEHVGFRCKEIVPLSLGPCTASAAMQWFLWPRILRPILFVGAAGIDAFVLRIKKHYRGKYPLGYVFVFEK
jgi:SAM-dependent methyltransferase